MITIIVNCLLFWIRNFEFIKNSCCKCGGENLKTHKLYQTKSNENRKLFQCNSCNNIFSETRNTFLFGLKKPISLIINVLKSRTEGLGFNATCRVHDISPHTLQSWEHKFGGLKSTLKLYSLSQEFLSQVIEGDELYTRVHKNKPQEESEGWTIMLMDRASRFVWEYECGEKDKALFSGVIERMGDLIEKTEEFTLVTDGERRYGNILFDICHEIIQDSESDTPMQVLKKGVRVGLKNKGQKPGSKKEKYERPQIEHPETNSTMKDSDIHANHVEGQNGTARRKLSPFRRRTNTYAKKKNALQRVLDVYWVAHNFVIKHFTTKEVPAVLNEIIAVGFTWKEILSVKLIA